MTRPEDIPDWAWTLGEAEARHFVQWLEAGNSTGSLSPHAVEGLADSLAHAIMGERERAAKIAASYIFSAEAADHSNQSVAANAGSNIATAIRGGQ